MNEENPLLGKRIIVTQTDNFVKYGEYYKHEHFGIWLKSDTETSFISFVFIKTIRPDPRFEKEGC